MGGIQYAAEWGTRRNDSLVAARLVYGACVDAELTVTSASKRCGFAPNTRLTQRMEVCEAQRAALARRLDPWQPHDAPAAYFVLP